MAKKEENTKKEQAEETEEEVKELSPLEKAEALAEDYKRKWYSVSAEYDNYRKRNAAAVSKAYADGASEAVLKLLPVADNFGYALDSASDEKTKAGIDKVIKSFNTVLLSLGVEEIEIQPGDAFDESVMEAVMNSPCEDGEQANTVKFVLKKGYRQGDRVIRFAQVSVTV
ncbi:MAG: nucleotide exchange factor GrpE [Clostridia bacterium]|nr:nucleotide exchange factor GrpE [Clostridia bacterium]